MSCVTLTRHYSGFRNVSDSFSIGNHEDAHTSVSTYALPDGYTVDTDAILGPVIRDTAGYPCDLFQHSSGRPQLISMGLSPVTSQPVLILTAAAKELTHG